MGTDTRWLEWLIPYLRRTVGEVRKLEDETAKLRRQVVLLEDTNRELREESELRSTKLQEQIARQAKNKKDFQQQIERRNQIMEQLQDRVSKQQGVIEKLTKRLETIQLEKDEVYEQYNRLFNHISESEKPMDPGGSHVLPTRDPGEEYVSILIVDQAWRLNMGCGQKKKVGYLNVDVDVAVKPDVVFFLGPSLPFASGTFSLIEAYHVVEHVYPWVIGHL